MPSENILQEIETTDTVIASS